MSRGFIRGNDSASRDVDEQTNKFFNSIVNDNNEIIISKLDQNAPGYLNGISALINKGLLEEIVIEKINDDNLSKNRNVEFSNEINDDFARENIMFDTPTTDNTVITVNDLLSDKKIPAAISSSAVYNTINDTYKSEEGSNDYDQRPKNKQRKEKEKLRFNKKIKLLSYLDRMREKGERIKDFDVETDYEELKYTAYKIRKQRKLKLGKNIFKGVLLDVVKLIEILSAKQELVNLHLDGWHTNLKYQLNEYDDVVDDIVEKYIGSSEGSDGPSMSPEWTLGLVILLSGIDHSATNAGISSNLGNIRGLIDVTRSNKPRVNQPVAKEYSDEDLLREIDDEKKGLK